MRDRMDRTIDCKLSKFPEVTLIFWVIKIAATTLGETAGDAVSMSMNLGYLMATAIFATIFSTPSWPKSGANGFIHCFTGSPS